MKRTLLLLPLLAVATIGLPGCYSSGGGGSNQVTITLTPSSANVPVGLTAQFMGNVSGSNNLNVMYEVNGVMGGDSVHGMIDMTGLYTAPSTIPNPATVTVTAIAQVNPSLTASAMVTIIASTVVNVNPSAASVAAGQQKTFGAIVNGTPSKNVNWQVNGVNGGDSIHGTITSAGVFTAPITPPAGGTVTVTAVSTNPVGSGSATVTITFSNATLHGQYAFSFSGTTAQGILIAAGSIQADGNGNITTGTEDVNSLGAVSTAVPISMSSYSITPDGRGTMTLILPSGFSSQTIRFVMLNNQHGLLIRFDTFAAATGSIDLQDSKAFSNAALAPSFVFGFFGVDPGNLALAFDGAFTPLAAGTNGIADVNDAGAASTNFGIGVILNVTSTSTGRGTAAVTGLSKPVNFAFYVVDAKTLNFVELDSGPVMSGQALAQANGPFSLGSFSGNFAFTVSGTSTAGALGIGGVFASNGNGGVTSGTLDVNETGTVTLAIPLLSSSSYTLPSNGGGRGTLVLNISSGSFNFAIYPAANGTVEMLETDTNVVTSGAALTQTTGSLVGSFGLNLDADVGGAEFDGSGQTNMDSSGKLSGGLLDFNAAGTLSTGIMWSGSIPIGANGRGTGTLTTNISNFPSEKVAAYAVNGSTVLLLGIDTGDVSIGMLSRQF